VQKYKNNDYAIFEKLNGVVQNAIKRAQEVRKSMLASQAQLFQTALNTLGSSGDSLERDQKRPFAKSKGELENRIRDHYSNFIQAEKKRYGEGYVKKHQVILTQIYHHQLEDYEKNYLYVDATGRPLTPQQKENVFTLHVLKALASGLDAHTEFFTPAE